MPQDTGTRSCVRRIRCLRCGCPSPDHPNANKYGGVSMASDTLCVACHDSLTRKAPIRALHHGKPRTRADARQQTLTEATE
jgi:hypothetical protein